MKFTKSSKSNVSFTSNSRKPCPISAIKYTLICVFFVCSFKSFAQKYFNDTLHFDADNTTVLSMTMPTDSGIYVAGVKFMDATGYTSHLLIGFIDTLGNSSVVYQDYDPNNYQIVHGSTYKLFLNTSGNFVLAYSNVKDTNEYPRIKEVSPEGQLLRDIRLDTIIDMGLFVKDVTRIYQHKDSSYWLWSISSFEEAVPQSQLRAGPLLTILDKNFHVDTIIRYYFDPQKKWNYYFFDEIELDSGNVAVWIGAGQQPLPSQPDSLVKSNLYLLKIGKSGNIIDMHNYQENYHTGTTYSFIRSIDSASYVTLIYQGDFNDTSVTYSHYIVKFDNSLNIEWKTFLCDVELSYGAGPIGMGPIRIISTSDSNYLALYTNCPLMDYQTSETIYKISPTGEILWKRNFWRFTNNPADSFNFYFHDLTDVRECPDGGFAFPGEIMSNTFQVGWLVKTNCLGFLGPPEVAFAYKNSKAADRTFFYNISVQAGSYFWDFGDGTTLNTDEYADTLVHQYADTGFYQITLIGYGCNGEADTLRYEIHVTPPPVKDSTITQVGEGYFTFFPNPVQTGNALYVYLNGAHEKTGKEINLSFYSSNGKIVQNTSISSKKGYYTISNTLSSGLYFVHLTQNGNNIAVKKLVVM